MRHPHPLPLSHPSEGRGEPPLRAQRFGDCPIGARSMHAFPYSRVRINGRSSHLCARVKPLFQARLRARSICPHPGPLPEGEGVFAARTSALALTPALSQRERESLLRARVKPLFQARLRARAKPHGIEPLRARVKPLFRGRLRAQTHARADQFAGPHCHAVFGSIWFRLQRQAVGNSPAVGFADRGAEFADQARILHATR